MRWNWTLLELFLMSRRYRETRLRWMEFHDRRCSQKCNILLVLHEIRLGKYRTLLEL